MKNSTSSLIHLSFSSAKFPVNTAIFKKLFYCYFLFSPLLSVAIDPVLYAAKNTSSNPSLLKQNNHSINFAAPLGITESIRTNLFLLQPDNSLVLADGVYTEYNNLYHDSVTMEDAGKMTNILENIGLLRYGKTLSVERRPIITANDTLFYKLWKTTKRNYQIELVTNFTTNAGLQAFFLDSYLNTITQVPASGSTKINFTVNSDSGSAAVNRFKVIFRPLKTGSPSLPVMFTSEKACRQADKVAVDWKVENETDVIKYDIEKSTDEKEYTVAATLAVKGLNKVMENYAWVDDNPGTSSIFYRIKSTGINGNNKYTSAIIVKSVQAASVFTVYPNPVKGNTINLQIGDQPTGTYQIKLVNNAGQVVYNGKVQATGNGSTTAVFVGNNVSKGIYQLEIKNTANSRMVKTVLLQ